jgi:hypothetical protein
MEKRDCHIIGISRKGAVSLILYLLLLLAGQLQAQPCNLAEPTFFGLAPPAPQRAFIYCRGVDIGYGVFPSTVGQKYTFELYSFDGTLRKKKKGGPLDGNGGTLSVAATMRSAQDAGEYRITTTKDGCVESKDTSFYGFYGSIDNLSITAWGSNAVTFRWAPCGPKPAVTYEYAVSTQKNPTLVPAGDFLTTTDTFATKTGLTNNAVYYIHVRVSEIIWKGEPVEFYFSGCSEFQWDRIMFTACSGAATIGTLTPVNAVACEGGSATLTATGGTTYTWYRDTILTPIANATSATYSPTLEGEYRVYVTNPGVTCKGMIKTSTLTKVPPPTGILFGGGNYFAGDTVRLGINNTTEGLTYTIKKDGADVYSFEGIGNPNESNSNDTVYYKFAINSAAQAGHYSVRVSNPYCSTVDFGSVDVTFVASVTICPGSNATLSFLSTGNNTSFQWQLDSGTGFGNISNSLTYSGVTTKTLVITNPMNAWYGYKYRCVATGGTPVTSTPRTLKFGVTWQGNTSTAWATATNWSCNVVPNTNTDVIIQPGVSPGLRMPVISADITIKSIWVKDNATMTIPAGRKLTLTAQ